MKISLSEVRSKNYVYHSPDAMIAEFGVDPNNWRKNPYTYLKSRYYVECASVVTYIFLKIGISANNTTLLYIFFGLLGSILISLGYAPFVYIGTFLIFNKGVFDWADGQIARWKKQESLKGHILDLYGARFNSICFNSAIGFYCYNTSNQDYFLYLAFGNVFFNATLIRTYASDLLLRDISSGKISLEIQNGISSKKLDEATTLLPKTKISLLIKRFKFLQSVFDDRARSVDFILLILLLEQLWLSFDVIPYIFFFVTVKSALTYFVDYYIFSKGFWLEKFKKS